MKAAVFLALLTATGCGPTIVWYGMNERRTVRVEVRDSSGRQWVRLGARDGRRYEAVGIEAVAVSPDGRHVAYPARRAGRWRVVHDGRESRAWDGIGDVVLSPDGRGLAYAALERGRWTVVQDGDRWPSVEALLRGTLGYSPDGRHLVVAARERGHVRVILERRPGPALDGIGPLRFGGGGARLVHAARRGRDVFVVIHGQEGPVFQAIGEIAVARRGTTVAYAARDAQGWQVRITEPASSSTRAEVVGPAAPSMLQVSDDGAHVSYVVARDGAARVVRDGAAGPPYSAIEELVSGPGERWGYIARAGQDRLVVIEGRAVRRAPELADLALGADGRHAFVLSRRERAFVVVGGRSYGFDRVIGDTLTFGPDGRSWGCIVGDRQRQQLFFLVDGAIARRFELDELAARLMRATLRGEEGAVHAQLLRGWVSAELARPRTRTR